jgi:hypothetical protein
MCWPHVVAANLAFTGPAARCSAYRLNPDFSRSRDSNSPTPCTARNSAQSFTTRPYVSHELVAGAPLAGNSRSHRFTATVGRGATGPSSNRRSSSTSAGMPSGINGRCSTSHDCQPRAEKKLRSRAPTVETPHTSTQPPNPQVTHPATANRNTGTKRGECAAGRVG